MKPAPATSALATSPDLGNAATSAWASSRGFLRAALASRIATLDWKSPCWESLARSTTTRAGSTASGKTEGTSVRSASRSRRSRSDFTGDLSELEITAAILSETSLGKPIGGWIVDPPAGLISHRRLKMKTTFSSCLVAAALLAGTALASDAPRSDAPRDEMRSDADGDGRVSRAEASAAATERSNEWFDKLDLNKDGYVTQDEMRQARETRHANMQAKKDEYFKAADVNSDGQLSLDEVQAKMPRLAGRFSALDKDKNGMLSKDELARGPRHQPAPQS